ncbi:hypothetical protein XYCOK13_36190 [Xylanibacillus composti]|uniref:SLH domain-containing protein n=2 Tax=Xylanibacillus composti TaxID=1572762 RepID=A0A8J4H6S9_9BACL|nr:hypothetical protein XYCOK13_36190 [Xylanibacillus composti]
MAQGVKAGTPASIDHAGHWAKETIDRWLGEGWLRGFPDGSVRPDQPIARAEYIALINRVFGFTKTVAASFHDVEPTDWYAPDVGRAVAAGYITGYSDNTFRPHQEITRQEAAVTLQRILGLDADPAAASSFTDQETIPDWSRGAVGALAAQEIINGYPDGRLGPEHTLTRAQAVVMLDKSRAVREATQLVLNEPGETFGPDNGAERIAGSVIVTAPDTTLRNLIITGDLVIAEQVGEGDVTLHNVEVQGSMEVYGGGSDSIHLDDSTVVRLVMNKENGLVRIVVSGDTVIKETVVYSPVLLEAAKDVIGEGYQRVTLFGSDMDMRIVRAVIGLLHVTEEVSDSTITLVNDARIIELIMDGEATIIETVPGTGPGLRSGPVVPGPGTEPEPTVTQVTYDPESLSLIGIGQTRPIQLTAHWSDDTTRNVTDKAVWSSDDETIASVKEGVVTAVGDGTTVIRAEYDGFTVQIPVSVVRGASYANVTLSPEHVAAGENIRVTLAVYRSNGDVDTDFAGEKTVTVSGYTNAPSGTAGSFEGTPLIGASTDIFLPFTDGKASGNLVLHHAVEQTIWIDVAETGDSATAFTITPQAAEPSKLEWMQKPSTYVTENEVFEVYPMIQVTDAYGNPIGETYTAKVNVDVIDSTVDYILSGTTSVTAEEGIAAFPDLTVQGVGTDAVLRFALDGAEIAASLDSEPIEVGYFASGDGTADHPYLIETPAQLARMTLNLSAHYQLNADIMLSNDLDFYNDLYDRYFGDAYEYVKDSGWMPIGTEETPFTGTFDGNGHTISDLKISRDAVYQGLFGYVESGEIRNVALADVEVWSMSSNYAGALAGTIEASAKVSDVSASGVVVGDQLVGGLTGMNKGSLTRSSFRSTFKGIEGNGAIGGLAGGNHGSITQSFFVGEVGTLSSMTNIGGLVGSQYGTISNSYAIAVVKGIRSKGGLIGYAYAGTVANSYTSSELGITGSGTIEIRSSYHQHETDRDPANGTWVTDEQMKQQATFEGWDFDNIWYIEEGAFYPMLRWQDTE